MRNKIINQAKAWIGKNMYNGSHKDIIDLYNSKKPLARGYAVKYTDAWCATFISALAIKCGISAIPLECGCEQQIRLFKAIGCWEEKDNYKPKAADIIYYDWDDSGKGDCTGWAEHVGIVEYVKNNTISVIEGNISGAVGRREIPVNSRYIRGYGIPQYKTLAATSSSGLKFKVGDRVVINGKLYNSSSAASPSGSIRNKTTYITRVAAGAKHPYNTSGDLGWMDAESVKVAATKSIDTIAKEVIDGKWGNGAERVNKLEAAGYDAAAVQKRVNQILQ